MKKQAPPGVATVEEVFKSGKDLPLRERAFLYGLWLTGARCGELCRLTFENVFRNPVGEWCFRLPVLKWKKPGVFREWPFILLPPNETEERMLEVFLEWFESAPRTDEGFVFGYEPKERIMRWKTKDGQVKERVLTLFREPYYALITKGRVKANLEGEAGMVRRTLPPHFVRTSAITAKAEQIPEDPTLVKDWVKHAKYDTTLRYIMSSRSWKQRRLEKAREARARTLPQRVSQPEAGHIPEKEIKGEDSQPK